MLDDDFKEIENFLNSAGNVQLQTFQKFEIIINDFITKRFQENAEEAFMTMNQLIYHSYDNFEEYKENTVKDFAITIIVIKKLISTLQNSEKYIILNGEEKKEYLNLAKLLMKMFSEELNDHLNFFKGFLDYIDEINNLLSIED